MFILNILVAFTVLLTSEERVYVGQKMAVYATMESCEASKPEEDKKLRAIFMRNGASVTDMELECKEATRAPGDPV